MKNQITRRVLSVMLSAVVATAAFSAPVQEMIGVSSAYAATTTAAPKASKKAGTYSSSGSYTIKLTADSGADIYYSTGGSYKRYTKALSLTKNTTVKCYAIKNGVKSKVVSYKYKLTPKVTVSAASGTYDEPLNVTLSSTASGVKFYYTLDGKKPTTKSTLYTAAGIKVSSTAKLRIAAVKSGWTTKYVTRQYTISDSTGSSASGESILDDYESKYAYNKLTSTQKKVYAAIFKAAANHDASTDISDLNATSTDVYNAYWAFDYENPQFFWLGQGYAYSYYGDTVYSVALQYSRSASEAQRLNKDFEAAAQKIIDKAMKKDDVFSQLVVFNDELCDMTTYTRSGPSYISEADGPLLNGKALCEGYSKAFMYLCQSVGIECICVKGYAGAAHMWNMIKVDGKWYNMDVTWNDTDNGKHSYAYFCIPTDVIEQDHTFQNDVFAVPSAVSDDLSYAKVMGITSYSDASTAYNELITQAAANFKKGVYTTTVYVKDTGINSLVSKVKSGLFDDLEANGCSVRSMSCSYGTSPYGVGYSFYELTLSA